MPLAAPVILQVARMEQPSTSALRIAARRGMESLFIVDNMLVSAVNVNRHYRAMPISRGLFYRAVIGQLPYVAAQARTGIRLTTTGENALYGWIAQTAPLRGGRLMHNVYRNYTDETLG